MDLRDESLTAKDAKSSAKFARGPRRRHTAVTGYHMSEAAEKKGVSGRIAALTRTKGGHAQNRPKSFGRLLDGRADWFRANQPEQVPA